jgi:hypothetical protein
MKPAPNLFRSRESQLDEKLTALRRHADRTASAARVLKNHALNYRNDLVPAATLLTETATHLQHAVQALACAPNPPHGPSSHGNSTQRRFGQRIAPPRKQRTTA